jgi:hypothetical protein
LPVCSNDCVVRVDSRTKETCCFIHGTLTFVREVQDLVDDTDLEKGHQQRFKYSDKFIRNAVRSSTLTLDELAEELHVAPRTLRKWREKAGAA